jgi:hypothetical protein
LLLFSLYITPTIFYFY